MQSVNHKFSYPATILLHRQAQYPAEYLACIYFLQKSVIKLKEEGNKCFQAQEYHSALGKYHHALQLSLKHDLHPETEVLRANCAQVCLRLELFSEAYKHSDECVKLWPQSEKVWHVYVLLISISFKQSVNTYTVCWEAELIVQFRFAS